MNNFKLGQKVKFDKYIKKSSYGKSKEVTKEFAEICGLKFLEDKSYIGGFWVTRCPWKGFQLTHKKQGIVCGVRNIGVQVYKSFGYDEWDLGIEKYKQVYLVADNMTGFYHVLPEWLESEVKKDG